MLFRSKRFLYSISALTVVKSASPLLPLLTNRQKKVQEILYILGVLSHNTCCSLLPCFGNLLLTLTDNLFRKKNY